MKKLFLGLIALISFIAVGVMAFGLISTGAWFSDTATTTDNTLIAGSLDLLINGQDDAVQTLQNRQSQPWRLENDRAGCPQERRHHSRAALV